MPNEKTKIKTLIEKLESLHLDSQAEVEEFNTYLVTYITEHNTKNKGEMPLQKILIQELGTLAGMDFKKAKESIGKLVLLQQEIAKDTPTFQAQNFRGATVGTARAEGTVSYALNQLICASQTLYKKEYNTRTLGKLNLINTELSTLQKTIKANKIAAQKLSQVTSNLGIGSCMPKERSESSPYIPPLDTLVIKVNSQYNDFKTAYEKDTDLDLSHAKAAIKTTQTAITETVEKLNPKNPLTRALETIADYLMGPLENIPTRIFNGSEDIFNTHGLFETTFTKGTERAKLIESKRLLEREEAKIAKFEKQFEPSSFQTVKATG